MNRLLLILMMSQVACDWSREGESQVISFVSKIPEVILEEGDSRLSMMSNGTIILDSIKFSGYLIAQYSDGSMRSKKGYYLGKMEGGFISYYPNGQVLSLRPYHLGEKHGEHIGYYKNGQLKFHYYFVDGLSQGTHKEWFSSGDLRKEMNYKDGKEFGSQKVWQSNGKIRSNYVVRENRRRYGMLGIKRCAKIDSETGDIDPYKGTIK